MQVRPHTLVLLCLGSPVALGACGGGSNSAGGEDGAGGQPIFDGAVLDAAQALQQDAFSGMDASPDGAPKAAGDEAASPVLCGFDTDAGAPSPSADAGLGLLPNLAAQYQGTFTSPPMLVDTNETTDAPLLGNGDVGVAVLGTIDAMTFILSKTEFWSLNQGTLKAMARLSLSVSDMANASYSMTENIGTGRPPAHSPTTGARSPRPAGFKPLTRRTIKSSRSSPIPEQGPRR